MKEEEIPYYGILYSKKHSKKLNWRCRLIGFESSWKTVSMEMFLSLKVPIIVNLQISVIYQLL